jgi:hypothetical protein
MNPAGKKTKKNQNKTKLGTTSVAVVLILHTILHQTDKRLAGK